MAPVSPALGEKPEKFTVLSMSANLNNIPMLTGINFGQWKEYIIVLLDCMDLEYAFRHDRLAPLTDDSTVDQKMNFDKWGLLGQSNSMSLMIMRMSIPESLRSSITEQEDAKTFLKELADRFASNEKVETTTLLMKLVSTRYTGKGNIREYIMEMSNLITRLTTLKLDMSESVLVNLILISLPTQFTPFKISFNIQKEKWTLNELIAQCIQEEERLRGDTSQSAHCASSSQYSNKKKKKGNGKSKGKQLAVTGASGHKVQKQQDSDPTCFFCKKKGHLKRFP
ncbi:uncharacterized protein LOC121994763 [Zingiber officinale]|uniref:uncharacterized protein LOC121994763 n=1 Tax=Zingiber officinale TaxID=94328 RepID=UPI001C4B4FAA|nr:uncharacterized protein LOC121994763 [Zingiber officinale]